MSSRPSPSIGLSKRSAYYVGMTTRVLCLALLLAAPTLLAQQPSFSGLTPDELAGRWEAADGHGGAVGMNIIITTHLDGRPSSIVDHVQYEDEFTVGVYHRTGPDVQQLDFNFFSTVAGRAMTWDGHHLVIHLAGTDFPRTVNLDLTWREESRTWSGLFERDTFRQQVVLKRPTSKSTKSRFVGTWFNNAAMMNNCVHISQEENGALTAWSDDLQNLSRMRYANGIPPATQTMEHYGEIAKVSIDTPDQITVELRTNTAGCCSHPFTARVSGNGRTLSGNWLPGPNQILSPVTWLRMPAGSCLSTLRF